MFSGAASTARALSSYFDSLINFAMKKYFIEHFPLHSGTFSEYADLFAMSSCLILTSKFNQMKKKQNIKFLFSSFINYWCKRISCIKYTFYRY